MKLWLDCVGSASWEVYDEFATDLSPDVALARVNSWVSSRKGPEFYVPIVQRSRIEAWVSSHWAEPGIQVWHLDGDH